MFGRKRNAGPRVLEDMPQHLRAQIGVPEGVPASEPIRVWIFRRGRLGDVKSSAECWAFITNTHLMFLAVQQPIKARTTDSFSIPLEEIEVARGYERMRMPLLTIHTTDGGQYDIGTGVGWNEALAKKLSSRLFVRNHLRWIEENLGPR